ncbi:MAG: PspC domain-containing protein [Sphingomonas sp.]|uniref:PspC domain-containing protein n=1 Tax=Sphingomonas sp. TaxID=28214 RepID=UPI003F807530
MSTTTAQSAEPWQNLFGVCACLGEDFGFNPLYLRLLFGMTLIFAPIAVISAYFGLGALVLVSRLVFPKQRRVAAVEIETTPVAEIDDMPLPLAA